MDQLKRREFMRWLGLGGAGLASSCSTFHHFCSSCIPNKTSTQLNSGSDESHLEIGSGELHEIHGHADLDQNADELELKRDFFERDFPDDLLAKGREWELVKILARKLGQVQSYVGHGNFNIVSWDEMIGFARIAPGIDPFTKEETLFLERLFYFNASKYGFMGDKVFDKLTVQLNRREVYKVPYSGHFLKRGASLDVYSKVKDDVGETLILTSGFRGLVKQFHLFLEKTVETKGNYSRASRSLAPPGYSFHGRGDFDVGKVGHGLKNFTGDFASTDEYKRLIDLGYVDIRYTEDNLLGVRFEPWHIKVTDS
jgi:D-alanyl-D-alanine carboxypeptidase